MINDSKEYLSFVIEEEEYAIDILDVREVRGWTHIRALPNSPSYILGVLELRGEYIPIIDLRQKFGFEPSQISDLTVVILLKFNSSSLGIIVDAVADVYPLTQEQVQPPPLGGEHPRYRYIKGIANINNKHIILVKLEKFFDLQELDQVLSDKIS
ncbi:MULTISPECIES: chemotaxis protein CheW [Vibrio]|uniref:Chemotaxis protein CheW n=1 Tax=Vibrio proteolyticus NBRC 13287 TaxID=1219065 RepID=U2ZVB1_VIBPR|nr:chemotaxis protein CheW [Vibrio proteolyticus]NAW58060.1 chemotaxis protein CheW [Vibrio sp. V36_P2S2PM302]NAX20939.1 chemotaxis protein CheW [Vibrio sp. V39_P1S14PM300]NAX26308.1 chemotaxis protein CheW [Vibrio sp. V38_P2S17PM301]NAX31881.1 chemotaxis protein CheW [Vibrio sp. V37_P2S8PM304]GAD65360.1 chemotaxis protein CheW [Vibrio proteolyticus NBRC 13287]